MNNTAIKTFRAPCGAAGMYDQHTVIEAYCGAAGTATENCDACPEQGRCEYIRILDSMPHGFSWEAVCGWEECRQWGYLASI